MLETLIKVENVSKKFCRDLKKSLWYGVKDVAGELTGRGSLKDELRPAEFWSVNDVSFEVKRGECLGLIGPNGAGKSTLLKLLSGLIKPDRGRISIRGRIGALIELGAGFNPILTGRENIYVNGAVLGFTKDEIDHKFDRIVEFSEIGEFIDSPVQNYSSGMKVRLGFSVAAQMDPDILIIDEVLAVGDAAFRTKCLNRMDKLSKNAALIFVTHSMPMMARISSSVLLMDKGIVKYSGSKVEKGILDYFDSMRIDQTSYEVSDYLKLRDITIKRSNATVNYDIEHFSQNDNFGIELFFEKLRNIPDFFANIAFFDLENKPVLQSYSSVFSSNFSEHVKLHLKFDNLPLTQGRYSIHLSLVEAMPGSRKGEILYTNRGLAPIRIAGGIQGWAPVQLPGTWSAE